MARADRFLKACRGEPVDATPVWLMRQAGRYMAEYRALRERHSLLEMIKTPELAAEVTLQPVRAFPVDAAIIFADILPVLEELGFDLTFVPGTGPVIANPVRSAADVRSLCATPGRGGLDRTAEAIRLVRRDLDGTVPLIGFAGAPFTLGCYAVEGGSSRDYLVAKGFLYAEPKAWGELMDRLTETLTAYLRAQVEAGAQALQIFDSWAGILSPADYWVHALPYTRRIVEALRPLGVPIIHFGTGLGAYLPLVAACGADVIGIDWRIDLADARAILGWERPVQGNLDPALLLAPADARQEGVARVLAANGGRTGFIFNLGHGVYKQTPPEAVLALVEQVHAWRPVPPKRR
jgi:uroporphyrinogen decarboxylase